MYLRMASKSIWFFIFVQIINLSVYQMSAFPTPESVDDKSVYNRRLSEERPLQEQIAEADSGSKIEPIDNKQESDPTEAETDPDNDDFRLLKSLAAGSKDPGNETIDAEEPKTQYVPDDSDSTKSRRLADDYDSTKTGTDYTHPDDPESFRQVDGTPLTAEDIVQKIATKIYEEDDRGVFDRIVSKLLKLGLITDSQADTLEYEVAEALQELITKNAKDNEVDDLSMDYPISRGNVGVEQNPDANMEVAEKQEVDETPSRKYKEEQAGMGADDTVDRSWATNSEDGLQDLQYFPNFYSLLKSLNTEKDAEERETLITIMKTLIDFVKMMVKYGTITPEEGVAYLENLDAMIAVQTKSKLGKSLDAPDGKLPAGQSGKSNTYLEAIRKNIEWLKKHNKDGKDGNREEYDLSKLRDFMNQQVDSYIDRGILPKAEGEVIKRIYGSL
ncbi:secretogranin-3-like isoform X2 [Conger conger]|uniref:secretogranin-3-like isoform X2 n=1 Tax=Conger conger TaxID=82655 RepID=UPI002A5A15BB|nr:secretogranin-3-like isoform X2 [Conger conger]